LVGFGCDTHFDQSTDSWSLFGQADFDVTERVTISGGIRCTDEEKDVDLARIVLTPGIHAGDIQCRIVIDFQE
jgi:iron complex outermembrane receptor protein